MDILQSPDFPAYVRELLDRHHVPGLAIAVVHDGTIVSAGFGKASLDPDQDCTADTLFDIASASKSLTAASVAILVNDAKKYPEVTYDTPVAKLLPDDFVMPGSDHDGVTVEDILSHRTGMAAHDSSYLGIGAKEPDDARSITRNLRNLAVVAPNRTQYIYNNMMYTVASYLVEKTTGQPFADFLKTNIFGPLEMNATALHPHHARETGLRDHIAIGYHWNYESEKYDKIRCKESPEAQGAGNVVTSANDYIKWIRAIMMHQGPISEDVYSGMVKKRIAQSLTYKPDNEDEDTSSDKSDASFYATGFQVRDHEEYTKIWHEGSDEGFRSTHFFIPQFKFGGVMMSNSDGASEVISMLTHELVDWVAQNPQTPRKQWEAPELEPESDPDDYSDGDDGGSDGDDESTGSEEEELRVQFWPDVTSKDTEQQLPLTAYLGRYWNPGYRGVEVVEKDGKLHVDGTDRSMGFCLNFKHAFDQTKYIAYEFDGLEGEGHPIKAEFVLKDDKAVKLGLHLEAMIDDYIWFERVESP